MSAMQEQPHVDTKTSNLEKFYGSWVLGTSEKFDEFLAKKGVPWLIRKMITATPMTKTIKEPDAEGFHEIVTSSLTKTLTWKFKLGEEFDADDMDKTKHKVTITVGEDGSLRELNKRPDAEQPDNYWYTVEETGEMILNMDAGDFVAKRFFKKKA